MGYSYSQGAEQKKQDAYFRKNKFGKSKYEIDQSRIKKVDTREGWASEYEGIAQGNQKGFESALDRFKPYEQYDLENAATVQEFLRDPSNVESLPGYAYGLDQSLDAVNDAYSAAGRSGSDYLTAIGDSVRNNYQQNVGSYLDMYRPRYNSASAMADLDIAKSNDLTEGKLAGLQIRNPKAFAKPVEKKKSSGLTGIGTIGGAVIGGLTGGPAGAQVGAQVGSSIGSIF